MSLLTQDRESALMIAARWGKSEAVVELAKAGANVNLQNNVCHCICRILAKYHNPCPETRGMNLLHSGSLLLVSMYAHWQTAPIIIAYL